MSSSSKTRAIMPRQMLRGHTNWVNGVVHLHARRQIITCSTDRSLRLWNLESGTQIGEDWRDEEDEAGVWSMALSPNSKTVASGSGRKVKLWDVETRKVIATWSGHANTVGALDWSADGKRVLSGSWDETVRVWDVKSGKTVLTIETGHRWVTALIYSPDGAKIATGGDDENAVKIWDANTGELFDTLKHDDPVWSLAWTSDGKKLISTSYDLVRIYDTTTWREIAHLGGDGLKVNVITLSQNNRLPVGPLLQHEDGVNCAALSADGKLLVTGRKNGNVYVWDIQAILKEAGLEDLLRPSTPHQTFQGHTGWVNGVVHLHARQQIIACSTDGSLGLWDLESSTQIGECWRDSKNPSVGVWSMALSPNSKTIALGYHNGNVKLWDVETRKVIARWSGHTKYVCALCWSGDGKRVLSGSWDGTARVWDVESSQTVLTIKTGHRWVNAVIFSPDYTQIGTGGYDESAVKTWDAKTGESLNTIQHLSEVRSLACTSDGKKLISGSSSQIGIYDTTTWQQIAILGHTFLVKAIALSQNDRLLCASDYTTVRIWNLDTNLPVGPHLQHEVEVNCAALSADGKVLVTGCQDKNAYVWDIHAILKEAGHDDLLRPSSDVMDADATQAVDDDIDELSPGFFNDAIDGVNSSGTYRNYHPASSRRPHPLASSFGSVNTLFGRLSLLFRRSQSNTEPQQCSRRALLSRGPRIVEVAAVKDREVIFTAPPPPDKTQQQTQSHAQESSTTHPPSGTNPTIPRRRYPLPVRLLAHLVLFLCCASPQHADGNAQPIQQEGQPQGQVHAQASSLQSHPAAPSTSATPTARDSTHTIAPPGAASA